MKKILMAILVILSIICIALKNEFDKKLKVEKKTDLEVGSQVKAKLNDDIELDFYIVEINQDNFTLILKDSLEKLKCEDEKCTNLNSKIFELNDSWINADEVRLVKNSDILSEEDLKIDSDSICTRLDGYLTPDQEGYYLKNVNNNKIGYVKAKDNNCVDINFESVIDKEYSLKPIITINKTYIIES